jgi:chaperone protein EcpD
VPPANPQAGKCVVSANFKQRACLAIVAYMCACAGVSASVIVGGTRVIYPGSAREVTVKVNNVGNDPSLVQVWADGGDASVSADKADAPFVIMPPIFRIDPANAQTLRIIYTHEPLPQDKESVFWLNVLDVPPSLTMQGPRDANVLQLAIRTRIKIVYRPENLPGDSIKAAEHIKWHVVPAASGKGYALRGMNASAYAVSFNRVGLSAHDKAYSGDGGMILPGGTTDFLLKSLSALPSGVARVSYQWINDYGAGEDLDAQLESLSPR